MSAFGDLSPSARVRLRRRFGPRRAASPLAAAALLVALVAGLPETGVPQEASTPFYVGTEACKDCHEEEYVMFTRYARKARSFDSVTRMKKGLTLDEQNGCCACHSTGYGKPGGFVSIEKTPALKHAGCEVCHGPGSRHVKTGDTKDILGNVSLGTCRQCHTEERIKAFRYRPLLRAGAH